MAEKTTKQTGEKKKSPKKGFKIALFAIEITILVGLLVVMYIFRDFGKASVVRAEFVEEDIEVNEPVQENEQMKGYRNIALFGVDSTSGSLTTGTRSDTMIVASINMDTGEIKLVSVYRDTYLNLSNDKYRKCNGAYFYGGAKQAMAMLNLNLDLDITDFVTVGFQGLMEAVNALGGIWIDVDSAEMVHLNNYQITMAEDLNCAYTALTEEGYQKLDGLQAVAYCRVRYTSGSDFKRAERQREVIQAIITEAQSADVATLVDAVNKVVEAGAVYTSLDTKEILEMVPQIANYKVVDEGGFPNAKYRGTAVLGSNGDCVLALDLEANVKWLHEFLFGEEDYEVSETVATYSQEIRDRLAEYQPDLKYPES